MKKLAIILVVVALAFGSCTRVSKKCKDNAKRAKKNKIGWSSGR